MVQGRHDPHHDAPGCRRDQRPFARAAGGLTMLADEARQLGQLSGRAVGGIALGASELHTAIADRVFRAVGPSATAVRVVHDWIAGAAYRATGRALAAGGWLGGEIAGYR